MQDQDRRSVTLPIGDQFPVTHAMTQSAMEYDAQVRISHGDELRSRIKAAIRMHCLTYAPDAQPELLGDKVADVVEEYIWDNFWSNSR